MKKIEILKSDTEQSKFRLIVRIDSDISLGVVLDRADMGQLQAIIRQLLENGDS